jgi:putative tryptophan/tyrosine transport system substrate-binding protein
VLHGSSEKWPGTHGCERTLVYHPKNVIIGLNRRAFVALAGGLVGWSNGARAQQGDRLRRIGVLMALLPSDPEAKLRSAALETGLRDLGWAEGRNIHIDYHWAEAGDSAALRARASELIRGMPELIVAHSTPVLAAFRQEQTTLPIVFVQVIDPIEGGFVPNFTRPGGHVTGFTSFEFSIGTKWLEALKLVAPTAQRVALIFNPDTAPFAAKFWQPVESAAASFDARALQLPVRDVTQIEHGIAELAREKNSALMVLPDSNIIYHRDLVIALAARHRLPAIYPFRVFAASGGLMSYGTDVADIYRRAAGYVDRILKGAAAGDLPVQAPNKFELVINLRTANALGLNVPPLLLARADEVIE